MTAKGKARREGNLKRYIARLYGPELQKANAEIARLRELISNQPHHKGCYFILGRGDRQCNCWKAQVKLTPPPKRT